jgi:hypothetical protein
MQQRGSPLAVTVAAGKVLKRSKQSAEALSMKQRLNPENSTAAAAALLLLHCCCCCQGEATPQLKLTHARC